MKISQFFRAIVMLSLHINYVAFAAQTTPVTQQNRPAIVNFYKDVTDHIIFNPNATVEDLSRLVEKYPASIASVNCQNAWKAHRGQTLAHVLVNQGRLGLVLFLVENYGETLRTPSSQADQRKPGSTGFIALCMKPLFSQSQTELRLKIVKTILERYPGMAYKARSTDGITPMLAAACTHNTRLMQLIHIHCPRAYYQTTAEGETSASVIVGGPTKPTTSSCLIQTITNAPHLLTATLVRRIIASGKLSVLNDLSEAFQLNISDQDIAEAMQQAMDSKGISHGAKVNMRRFVEENRGRLQQHSRVQEVAKPLASYMSHSNTIQRDPYIAIPVTHHPASNPPSYEQTIMQQPPPSYQETVHRQNTHFILPATRRNRPYSLSVLLAPKHERNS